MKNSLRFLALLAAVSMLFQSCSKDDPEEPNEQEVITTLTMVLSDGATTKTFQFRDEDGDGGMIPDISADALDANTTYNYTVTLLNETESPAENVTTEIQEEDDEHQFFFLIEGTLNVTHTYGDTDDDGNPIGLSGTVVTGAASAGEFTVVLRHEPDKNAANVSDGDIANAGGETDIEVDFSVTIQ